MNGDTNSIEVKRIVKYFDSVAVGLRISNRKGEHDERLNFMIIKNVKGCHQSNQFMKW